MKLSIIMPVYNVEDYLAESIDSILRQSVSENEYEIIIVNDETPDRSMDIAEQYKQNHPQIKIINQKNGGISAARNTGLKHATGEYVLLLDSDDFYSADFFADLLKIINAEQPDLILLDFNYYYMKDNQHVREERTISKSEVTGHTGQHVLSEMLNKDVLFNWYPWCYAVKRSLIEEHQLYFVPNKNFEDIFWTPLLYLYADKMSYLDQPVLAYRMQRPGQITGNINLKNLTDPMDAPIYMKEKMEHIQVPAKLKHDILRSISNKYFKASVYARNISKQDRKKLISAMEERHEIIGLTSSPITKVINQLMVFFGIRNAVEMISLLYTVIRTVKKKKA